MATTTDMHPSIVRAIEAFNDHDADGVVDEFTEEGTFLDPLQDEELSRAERPGYTTEVFEGFPDVRIEVHRSLTADDATAVE